MPKCTHMRLPALRVRQGAKRTLYCFAVDGKRLLEFAAVSRLARRDQDELVGYQRPEIYSHISGIRDYLETDSPILPNAMVVAFDSRVHFTPSASRENHQAYSTPGTLVIPIRNGEMDHKKPGWIVDGQQRAAAIREANIGQFPVCVVGFIAASEQEQREQFILVNSTKPLPKGLVYELLPVTESQLPPLLQRRRFPSLLLHLLNTSTESPLRGIIRTPTCPSGVVKDNSVLKMLENSLTDGVLYRFRDPHTGCGDIPSMLSVLCDFWSAVAETFPSAWGLPPRCSRLMHGAGIVSLGFLMDTISDSCGKNGVPNRDRFVDDLGQLKDCCRWTDGYWEFGPGLSRKWDEIQNISRDILLLSNHLLMQYRDRVRRKTVC